MAGEKTPSDTSNTPAASPKPTPASADGAKKGTEAPAAKAEQREKPAVQPVETQKAPEKKDTKTQKTDIDFKKETIGISKIELQKKRNAAKEVQDGTKVYSEELYFLESMVGPGLVPPRPDQKMVKKEDYERSQQELQEQENLTAKAIEGKMDAELKSVTESGKIDQLDPVIQTKIRTEVVLSSIDPQRLPNDTKKAILATMMGADGKPIFVDMSLVDLENLTSSQKEYILKSDTVKNMASEAVVAYKIIQEEAKKNEQEINPKVVEAFCKSRGLPNTDALELSQLRDPEMKPTDFPANTQIGIVQRILAESTFNELRDTLADGMKWSHVPERVKLEIAKDSFPAESDKNTSDIQQAIIEAKAMVVSPDSAKKEGESPAQFETRFKEKTGAAASNLEALSLEARKSGLSPGMRALADFFGPIGAALGMPFWKEYMGENVSSGRDVSADTSDRYMTKDGNNKYTEKPGEVPGTQSPELAKNGFKGDVMNSIWRWEYQAGHNVEVVPAAKSGLTLCGGIDLAYTPYSQVQNIFKGILKEETIAKLQPFCDNGRRGPIRDQAQNLLRAKTGLKEEINGQLNYQNMGEAFTRSLALDWERLVNRYGSVVKNAPGYIQVFMLSRFYHAGIGGSSGIIRQVIASGFNHESVISIAENFRKTRSESYYRNRMGQEIAYLKSRPGDAAPSTGDIAQNTKDVESPQGQSPVQWFEENANTPWGTGEGQYDCMTSTHAALGLDYTKKHAGAFNGKFIDQKDNKNNLWNVAMASALYVGNITSANSDAQDGVIKKRPDGYYGEKADVITNMEYYIEENVMKRVNDSSDGIVDVGGSSTLIHYSKSKKGVSGIVDDIKTRLRPGESAMMGATGNGTNQGGHEWLIYNNHGILRAYDATNAGGQGVSGTGMELSSFLNDPRRAQFTNEAIIFAKKPGVSGIPQDLADSGNSGLNNEILQSRGSTAFVGDSHFNFLTGGLGYDPYGKEKKLPGQSTVKIPTVMSGGNMGESGFSISKLVSSPQGKEYIQGKKNIVVCLGTNDATMFTPQRMIDNMSNLVSNIHAINPEGKVIVVTPPLNRDPTINARIAQYESMLQAQGNQLGITVAPFYTYSQEKKLGMSGTDHLNTAGYQAMREYINSYI